MCLPVTRGGCCPASLGGGMAVGCPGGSAGAGRVDAQGRGVHGAGGYDESGGVGVHRGCVIPGWIAESRDGHLLLDCQACIAYTEPCRLRD